MARRKPVDRPQYVLLSEAQRLFAFRNLKQLIYYLSRHGSEVRQRPKGHRRYVCVADLAAALLRRDPRRHLSGLLPPTRREVEAVQETNDSLKRENDDLRQELHAAKALLSRRTRGIGGRQQTRPNATKKEAKLTRKLASLNQKHEELVSKVLTMEALLREHGLSEAWQKRWAE
jgi:hypothetical protein